jgi:hypothetical protein
MAMAIRIPVHLALNVPPWGQGASLDHVAAAALAALATGIALELHDPAPDLISVALGQTKPDGEAMGLETLGCDHAPPIFAGSGRGLDAAQDPSKLTDIWGMKDFIWLT